MSELQCIVFASIISADSNIYTEEQKQEVMRRWSLSKDKNWEYILEPVDKEGKLTKLFKE